ncbi:MAG: sensor domain-containing diguanylate cyclase [Bacteroidota bacterium]
MNTPATDKRLTYLAEILDVLRSTNQHEEVLHLIVDRLVRIYKCQACAVVLIDRRTEYLSIENSHGLSWTFCKEFRRRLATGPLGELLWTGKPILITNPDSPAVEDVRLEHPFGSCIIVQLAIDQRTLGYLYADTREVGVFDEGDIPIFQAFANAAAIALHKSHLHYENMHLDKTDHETGLEKYESFTEKLRASLDRAEKFEENFAVAILDVDNFKALAKTYGFETSKHFLKELGDLVHRNLRSIDAAGRYGSDEFIILLAKSSLEHAVSFARKLSRTVEEHQFTHHKIMSTISIGVAAYPDNGKTTEKLLTAAKNALFEAQRAGRNKVFHYITEWDAEEATLCEHN